LAIPAQPIVGTLATKEPPVYLGSAVVPIGFGPNQSIFGYNDYLGSFTCFVYEYGIDVLGFPAGQAPPQPGIAVNEKGVVVLDAPTGSGGYQYSFGTPSADGGGLNPLTLDPSSYLVSIRKIERGKRLWIREIEHLAEDPVSSEPFSGKFPVTAKNTGKSKRFPPEQLPLNSPKMPFQSHLQSLRPF
jgi:hypothetical protein